MYPLRKVLLYNLSSFFAFFIMVNILVFFFHQEVERVTFQVRLPLRGTISLIKKFSRVKLSHEGKCDINY